MNPTLRAYGISGRQYIFELFPIDMIFNNVPGIYEFVKQASNGGWDALYIGQTGNLRERLTSQHHQWNCARRHRATHIAILVTVGSEQERVDIETDLRRNYPTPCNSQ